jgi:hypothetical protein
VGEEDEGNIDRVRKVEDEETKERGARDDD